MAKAESSKRFARAMTWVCLFAATSMSCLGKLTKERRLLRIFDKIEVRGTVKVFVIQEDRLRQATVYGDETLLKSIVTEVRGRTLVIEADNAMRYAPRLPFVRIALTGTQLVEVIVSAEELQGVTVAGEGAFTGTNLKAKTFRVFSAGSGKVHLENLTADAVEVRLESDGDVILKGGVVERLDAELRGKGSLRAIDLPALRAHVSIFGTGHAEVRAENWLEAKLSGKGNLHYLGRPLNLFVQADGEGRVERIDSELGEEADASEKKEPAAIPDEKEKVAPGKKQERQR